MECKAWRAQLGAKVTGLRAPSVGPYTTPPAVTTDMGARRGLRYDKASFSLVGHERHFSRMYGPAVRCKRVLAIWQMCGLAWMYPAFDWSVCALGHHGTDVNDPEQTCSEPLLDHLVDAQQGRFPDHQPERIFGLEIDDQCELCVRLWVPPSTVRQ
jgi:hypothetical protein